MLVTLATIIVVLVIIGLVIYLIENYIPMSPPFKTALRVIVVLGICLWLLSLLTGIVIPLRLR